MKKYFTTQKYKKYNQKRAKASLDSMLEFKRKKIQRNKKEIGKPKKRRPALDFIAQNKFGYFSVPRKLDDPYADYFHIFAPTNFCLLENPEEVINFINQLSFCF